MCKLGCKWAWNTYKPPLEIEKIILRHVPKYYDTYEGHLGGDKSGGGWRLCMKNGKGNYINTHCESGDSFEEGNIYILQNDVMT
jgi:hypothetical protein